MSRQSIRWGIISTGRIAERFARALENTDSGVLHAVASRNEQQAKKFARRTGALQWHGHYQGLLDDPEVQAVYIATPHPMHAEWAVQAAEAGKHILCEKPMAMNFHQARPIVDAARRRDVFFMEAFMYRVHPQTRKLVELLQAGAIGQVRKIEANFSFHCDYQPEGRLLNNALGGGGILDVGCYCMSMARLVAGVATGRQPAEPRRIHGVGHVGATHVDEYASALLEFDGDIIAQISCGVQLSQANVVRIFGSKGWIVVPEPWIVKGDDGHSRILIHRGTDDVEEIRVPLPVDLYALEADEVAAHLQERQSPSMSWDDSLGNIKALDQWREQVGVSYAADSGQF